MSIKKPLVLDNNGNIQQLQTGDSLQLTAPNMPLMDNSTNVANTAFVQAALRYSMGTMLLNLIGGLYSFNSLGINATVSYNVISGVINSILSIPVSGTGYKVGDLLMPEDGNHDALLRVNSISGSGIATLVIVNGGTGYTSLTNVPLMPADSDGFQFTLTGALTSNVNILVTAGTYITESNQWIVANNTTGTFTVKFNISDSTNTAIGNGAYIPRNSVPNAKLFSIATDGVNDVWPVNFFTLQKIYANVPQMTGNTIIPVDNTPPLVTEGTQLGLVTITPAVIGSNIVIDFACMVDGSNTNSVITIAIFRNNTLIGFCCTSPYSRGSNSPGSISIKIIDTVTSLTPVNYSGRIGIDATGTWYLGRGANATMGGSNNAGWSITEEV